MNRRTDWRHVAAAAISVALAGAAAAGDTYYCTQGAGTGDGTAGDPWGTLQEALDEVAGNHVIICSNGVGTPFNETVTLGANMNGRSVTLRGDASYSKWHHVADSTAVTVTIATGANAFTLAFDNFDIARSRTTGTSTMAFVQNNNTSAGAKVITFSNLDIDVCSRLLTNAGTTAGNKVSLTIDDCTVHYGGQFITQNASTYMGDVVLTDSTFGATALIGTQGQGQLFNFSGSTASVDSVTMARCTVHQEGTLTNQRTLLLPSNIVTTIALDDCDFYYDIATFTGATSFYSLVPNGAVSVTNCGFYERMTGPGTDRGYTGAALIDFIVVTAANGNITFRGNTVEAYLGSATDEQAAAVTLTPGASTVVDFEDNIITSGLAAVDLENSAAGTVLDFSSNAITCDNTAVTTDVLTVVSLGENVSPDGPPVDSFGLCTINDNTISFPAGGNVDIGLMIGRDVGAATGAASEVQRNLVVGTPYASLGSGVGQIAVWVMGRNLEITHNQVFGRSALTLIGVQDSTVEHNSLAFDHSDTGKGVLSLNGHGAVDTDSNSVRYNVLDVTTLGAGSAVMYAEAAADLTDVLVDYNWYAAPAADSIGELDGTAYDSVADLQAGWDSKDAALAEWSGVTGNDVHSVESLPGVFKNAPGGDFTPRRSLRGWGAAPFAGTSARTMRMGMGMGL